MPFFDLKNMANTNTLHADICIVGAGAAGSVLALELAKSNSKIVLLESGGAQPDRHTQSLHDLENTGLPLREGFVSRVREYGGSCNTWTGRAMLYQPIDFEKKKWVPQSGWPLRLLDLKTYYQRAIPYLGLPTWEKFAAPFWFADLGKTEQRLCESPCLSTTVSLWARQDARFGFGSKHQQAIARSSNIDVVLGANLAQLELYENTQKVKRAKALSLNGNELWVESKIFILACGGLENARLLLLSNQQLPLGLGNHNGNVGRYFMDHPKFEGGIVELPESNRLNFMTGRPIFSGKVRLGTALSPAIQQKEALLNPYLTFTPYFPKGESLTNVAAIKMEEDRQRPVKAKPHYFKLARFYLSNALRRGQTVKFRVSNYLEQAPNPNSRVALSDEKDVLGLNKLRLNWQLGDKALKSVERLHHYLGQHLEANKIGRLQSPDFSQAITLSDASHHLGTTRMSESPKNGVVDQNCKVFDLDNLYVAGSSVFPTSGHANPTLTIVALAIKLADFLKEKG